MAKNDPHESAKTHFTIDDITAAISPSPGGLPAPQSPSGLEPLVPAAARAAEGAGAVAQGAAESGEGVSQAESSADSPQPQASTEGSRRRGYSDLFDALKAAAEEILKNMETPSGRKKLGSSRIRVGHFWPFSTLERRQHGSEDLQSQIFLVA